MSSSKVSVVVRNMAESLIFLKKGVQVVRVVTMLPVPPTELSQRWKQFLGWRTSENPYLWLSNRGNS